MIRIRLTAALVLAIASFSSAATAQDLSRYRDVAFGTSLAAVASAIGVRAETARVVHQRPALIQELMWRPQYALSRPAGQAEAAQDISFRFHDDRLFRITVRYEARLVAGLTNKDIIEAVSEVYGPPTLTDAASEDGPLQPPAGSLNGSTALARWQSADHQFTLMRDVYPATYRLIGVSTPLESLAAASEAEAIRLDREEAPRREAERALADAERKRTAEDKIRATNKDEFRP